MQLRRVHLKNDGSITHFIITTNDENKLVAVDLDRNLVPRYAKDIKKVCNKINELVQAGVTKRTVIATYVNKMVGIDYHAIDLMRRVVKEVLPLA